MRGDGSRFPSRKLAGFAHPEKSTVYPAAATPAYSFERAVGEGKAGGVIDCTLSLAIA